MKLKSGKFYNLIVYVIVIDIYIFVVRDVLFKIVRKYICMWFLKFYFIG